MSANDPLTPIDVKAPTLEKAIHEGLEKLGLSRNDVIIEIVEEGSRGVLGMGARDAIVRLTPLRPPPRRTEPQAPPASPDVAEEAAEASMQPEEVSVQSEEVEEDTAPASATSPAPPADAAPPTPAPAQVEEEAEREPQSAMPQPASEPLLRAPVESEEELEREARIAREALLELLEHMGVEADIDVYHAEPAPHEEDAPWILDVRGNDLGILIGRHGDTLNALQYITRLIVSRELQRRANIVVDVEGYKARREESLHKLAERMAQKAIQSGRTVTLDPMPPNERRVIHVALRDDTRVETESIGTGDNRRVTIIPTNSKTHDRR